MSNTGAITPVITTVSGQDNGSVTEDGTLKASGQLSATEAGNSHPDLDWDVVGSGHGTYGSLSIDDNGKWTYTLNNSASNVQALAQGESVTETFTVQVSDHGKVATEVVTVHIAGSDDAPVISASCVSTGTVQEDATLSATGKLTASDVDHGAALTWSVANGAGTYGSLSVDQTGKWVYTLNNAADNVQALAKNQQVTETFTVQVKDQFGATDTQTITVKVVGSNDAPVIAGTSTGTVQEDATLKTTGQLSATDVDHGSSLNWSVADNHGDYGTLSVDSTGKWTYTLNNTSSSVQALSAGQTVTDSFTVQVRDQYGTTTSQVVNVQVMGSNDAPVITSATTTGLVKEDSTITTTGTIHATDIDHNDTLSWSVDNASGTYGSLSVDATGKWTYTLNNASSNVQALAQGETAHDTFTVRVSDGHGGTDTQVVTLNIAGTNDGPTVSTPVPDQVVLAQAPFSFSVAGNFADVDHGAVLHYSATLADGSPLPSWMTINATTGVVSGTPPANLGGGTLNTVTFQSESADYHNTIGAYDIDANGNITGVHLLFANASAQGSGGTLVNGVSQATIASAPGQTVGLFLIADGFDVNNGFANLDLVNGHLEFRNSNGTPATVASRDPQLWYVAANGHATELSGDVYHSAANGTTDLNLNDDRLDHVHEGTANGQATYSFEDLSGLGDRDFNDVVVSMKQTPISTDSLAVTVTATDNYGASTSDTLNINLDHPPVANADTAAGTENQTLTINVLANDTDQDANSVLTVSAATVPQGQGSVSIVNNQIVFNPGTNFDHLAAGATQTVVVQYTIKDNFGIASSSTATITITGTDDAPVITSGPGAGSVQEDGATIATGQLTAADVDDGATQAWSVANGTGTYGSLAVNAATGTWTYTLNNNAANVQALAVGEHHTETFTVQVSDGLGGTATQQVNVVVTGTNDAPVVTSANQTGSVQEDSVLTATGQVTASDVDNGAVLHYAVANGAGTYGSLAVDAATGTWTYTLNNSAANVQALAVSESHTETFTVQVSDGNGGTTSQQVNVLVTGTNDAPVIASAAQSGAVQEDATLTATGQVVATDVDHGAVLSYAVANGAGTYGSLAIDAATGQWTYALNNSAANVQALAAGEHHTETFTVQVSDGLGGTATQQVNVVVAGTNDAPVITSADQAGSVQEDSVLTATGQVTAADIDNGTVLSYAVANGAGTYGALAVDATTGQWTYTLNNGAANVQALAVGESHTETFTVQVSDGNGGTTSQQVNVTVTGTNDAPVITSADQAGSVQEDSVLTATGHVTASDVDNGAVLSYAVADGAGTYGALSVDAATGQWTYALNNAAANVQALSAGESHTETFTVQVSDGNGGTTSQQVNVTVTGTNDLPVVTSGSQAGVVQEDAAVAVTGQFTASDVDNNTTLSYAVAEGAGTYGALAVDAATGQWIYTLNDNAANVQALAIGESHTETFTVQVADGNGGTVSQVLAITVLGTNDVPVVTSADQVGSVQEDSVLTATGQVTATDVDHGAVLSYAVVGGTNAYGALAVDASTGAWTYTLNNNAANVQALAAGESHTETFIVQVTDDQGATTSQQVNVVVTGTNDAPVVTSADQVGSVQEDSVLTATGQVTASDVDNGAVLSYAVADAVGTYGSLAVDTATGQWIYTLNNGAANVQALAAGESHTETFTVQVSDGNGGTTSQQVSVNVTGSNDAPIVTSADQAGSVQEDSVLTATGQVTASDVDHGAVLSYAVTDAAGTYGSLAVDDATGQWTYTLNNSAANVQALAAGESHTETFTVQISDGNGGTTSQQVNVAVTGTNDAPVITSADQAGSVQEDSVLTATGQVTASDVDHGAVLSYAVVDGAGAYGALSVDAATGQWTYSLNNAAANVQALAAGESHTETFTVQVSDGNGGTISQQVDVVVTGTNDAPVITSADQAGVVQEDSVLTATGQVTASDVDNGTMLSYAVVGDGNGAYGALAVDAATGQWTYTLDNSAENVQALAAGESHTETFTISVSDGNGGTTSQQIDVTVTGTNDAPVVFDAAATTDQNAPVTFGLSHFDTDANDTDTVTLFEQVHGATPHSGTVEYDFTDGSLGDGGHATLNADGSVTFDPGHDFDYLGAGESQVVEFGYRVTDNNGASTTGLIDVTVTGENDAPVVFDVAATADQNTPVTLGLNYYDPDFNDTDTVTLFTESFGSSGSASHASSGGHIAEHDFTDSYLPNGGHATLNADGTVTFDPGHQFDWLGAGETTDVVFNYRVTDALGATATGEIDITVTGENDAPVAEGVALTVDQNTPTNFFLPTYDPDSSDIDTVTLFETVSGGSSGSAGSVEHDFTDGYLSQGGHVVLNADGEATFDPGHDFDYLGAGESQVVEFGYRATDENGATTTAIIDITVTGENDAPVVADVSATADQNAPVTLGLNYSDPDHNDTDTVTLFERVEGAGSNVTVHDVTDGYLAQGGHAALNADGTVSFDPGHDFDYLGAGESQVVEFGYAVTDSYGVETDGVIDITVTGENDAPVALDISSSTDAGAPVTFALNYSDIDLNDTDTVTLFQNGFGSSSDGSSGSAGGVEHDVNDGYLRDGTHVQLNADGTVTFDANHQYDWLAQGESVTESFDYRVTDSQGATATAEIDVTITGVNADPTISGLPSTLTDQAAQPIALPGFSLSDLNIDDTLTVTLSVAHGTIQFNPPSFGILDYLTVTQTGDSVTISGPNAYNYLTPLFAGDTSLGSFTYTADAGFNGTDTITITAADNHGGTTSGTIAVDDVYFITTPDTAAGTENQTLTIDVLANDLGTALTLTGAVVPNGEGSVSVVNNQLVFNPGTDFDHLAQGVTQTVVATYTVQDDVGETKTETATITITGTNDAPVAVADTASTTENASVTVNVLANDTDADDGHMLTLATVGVTAGQGSVSIVNNQLVFNPGSDFDHLAQGVTQNVVANYTVQDEFGATSASTAIITVTGTNDAPVAVADTAITNQNTAKTVNVVSNDVDPDNGDVLTVTSISIAGDAQGRVGTASIVNNQVVFNPNGQFTALGAGQSTTNVITYTISDGHGGTSTSTETVTINGLNDAPVAVADTATTDQNTAKTVNVLANDTDPDTGDTLIVTNVSVAGDGSGRTGAASVVNNQVVFNPNSQFASLGVGQSTTNVITYKVSDGHGGTSTSTETVTITGVNDAPTAVADTATTDQNTSKTVNVVANDTDPDTGDTLTVTNVSIAGDAQGRVGTASIVNNQVVFNPNGHFTALGAGQSTTNVITYTISDGHGGTTTSTETVTITGVNDAPTAVADTATTDQNTSKTVNVLANDTDPDNGDTLTISNLSVTGDGSGRTGLVSIVNNQVVFNPNVQFGTLAQGQTTTNTVTYTVSDGHGGSSTAVDTITITGVNDTPVAVADTATTTENTSVTVNVLANDTDVDVGHVLTLSAVSVPAGQGSVSIVNNQLVFAPGAAFDHLAQGATQNVVASYTVKDEFGATSSSTATITVTGTNDAPVAVADTASTTENAAVTVNVLANDTDVDDGHVLTLSSVGATQGGTASIVNNQLVFDPGHDFDYLAAGATKTIVVNYTMHDEFGATSSSSETITVTGTNDAPVVVNETANGMEGTALTGTVLSGAYDPEGHVLTVSNAGTYVGTNGTLTLNFNGTYSYSLSSAAAAALGAGQTDSDTFTYTVNDGTTSSSAALTVHVAGMDTATAGDETISGSTMGVGITNQIPAYVPGSNSVDVYGQYPAAPAATGYGALINGLGTTGIGSATEGAGFGIAVNPQTDDSYIYESLSNLGPSGKDLKIQFFGQTFDHIYVDNNGLVSFNSGVSAYTGQAMPVADLPYPMIAPYWEDVDTRPPVDTSGVGSTGIVGTGAGDGTPTTPGGNSTGTDRVYYYIDPNTGVIIVTWDDVGSYSAEDRSPNAFQLLLMPTLTGGYSAVFRYESINRAYGDVSVGTFPQVGFQDGQGNNFNAQGTLTNQLGNLETLTNTFPALPGVEVYNISGSSISNGLQTVAHTLLDNDAVGTSITAVNGSASLVDTVFTLVNGGQLMIMPNGVYNYVAPVADGTFGALAAGETLTQTVSYTVTTSGGVSTVEHLNIVETGVNDAPQVVADVASVAIGGAVSGNLFANDSDIDHGTVLRLGTALSDATHFAVGTLITGAGIYQGTFGTLDVQMNGSYHYASNGLAGTDVFTYAPSDGITSANQTTLTLNVGATMSATNDAVSVDKAHTVVTGNVLTNDLTGSHTGQPLTVIGELDQVGTYGTLILNANGTYTYAVDPANTTAANLGAGSTLTDTFTYKVTDGITTQQATVAVTYTGGATVPTVNAADDHVTLTAGGTAYGFDSTPYLSEMAAIGTGAPGTNVVMTNLDDGSTFIDLSTLGPGGSPLTFDINGGTYSGFYINTNGSISFTQNDPTWHAGTFPSQPGTVIAPFFADVDQSANTVSHISYNVDTSGIVTVTWDKVAGYTNGGTSTTSDSFQLQLINQGHGETDAIFRYGTMQWTQSSDMISAGVYADVGLDYANGNSFLATPATATGTSSLATSSNIPGTPVPGVFVIDNVDDSTGSHTYTSTNTGVGGAAFSSSVLANDPGAATDTVTSVNGLSTAASIDHTVTLASGAQITMYADGEYIYRTGSAFDYLGAGQQATDSFTYTFKNASNVSTTQTVTMTINGAGSGDLFTGTAGNDTLVGNANNNTIVGGHGNDIITTGTGSDTIVFNFGDGHDTVTDFNTATDVLNLSSLGYANAAAALTHATQVGADTVFDFGNGDMITLTGVDKTHLATNDFLLS